MGWLVAAVVAIGFVWLLIASPRFRMAAFVVGGGLAAIMFFYISSSTHGKITYADHAISA